MRVIGNNIDTPFQTAMTNNSGTIIYQGRPVTVNFDGTIDLAQTSIAEMDSIPVDVFANNYTTTGPGTSANHCDMVYDPYYDKVIAVFVADLNAGAGTLGYYMVGQLNLIDPADLGVSNAAITWSTPATFTNESALFARIVRVDHFDGNWHSTSLGADARSCYVIAYRRPTNAGRCVASTFDGNTLCAFGSAVEFDSTTASQGVTDISLCYNEQTQKVLVTYSRQQNTSKIVTLNVSGNNLITSDAQTYTSSWGEGHTSVYDKAKKRVVDIYNETGVGIRAVCLKSIGDRVYAGSIMPIRNADSQYLSKAVYCEMPGVIAIAAVNKSNDYGEITLCRVAEEGGSAYAGNVNIEAIGTSEFHSASTGYLALVYNNNYGNDFSQGCLNVYFVDIGDSYKRKQVTAKVNSGWQGSTPSLTNISAEQAFDTTTGTASYSFCAAFTTGINRTVMIYIPPDAITTGGQAPYATVVAQNNGRKLTRTNFIGFSGKEVNANSNLMSVKTRGAVSFVNHGSTYDEGEMYFLNGAGNIISTGNGSQSYSLGMATPSAGVAISQTELVIKV